jgi:surface protein
MYRMFRDAAAFNQNIGGWDVSAVSNMGSMFHNAVAFNQDITGWTTTALTDSSNMFLTATAFLAAHINCGTGNAASFGPPCVVDSVASKTPNDVVSNTVSSGGDNYGPPSAWQSVTKFQSKAALATAITNCLLFDSTGFECCSSTGGAAADCGVAGTVDMAGWDVSGVTDMALLFSTHLSFNEPIGNWDVAQVTTMEGMFSGGSDFNQDIASWNTRRVTTMKDMFANSGFFDQNIGSWNTGAVTDMSGMFLGTATFNEDISAWDVSNVNDMWLMFEDSASFNQDITGWSPITGGPNFGDMFKNAAAFLADFTNCGYASGFAPYPAPGSACEATTTYGSSSNQLDGPPDAWQINPVVLATPTLAPAASVRDGYNAPATCSQTCKECNKFRWYIKTVPKSTPTSATRNLRRSACQRCRDCRRT